MSSLRDGCRSVKVEKPDFGRSSVKFSGGAKSTSDDGRRARLIAALRAEQALPGLTSWAEGDAVQRQLACATPSARAALGVLLRHVDNAAISGPSQQRIATQIKVCKRTVIRAVQELAAIGALVAVYERSVPTRTIAVYRLHPAIVADARQQRSRDLQRVRAARGWSSRRCNVTQTTSSFGRRVRDRENKHLESYSRGCLGQQPDFERLIERLQQTAAQYGTGPLVCRIRAQRLVRRHGIAQVARRLDQALRRPAWVRGEVADPAAYLMACCARELPEPASADRIFAPECERESRRSYAIALQREREHEQCKRQAAIEARSFVRTMTRTRPAPGDFVLALNAATAAARERLGGDPWLVEHTAARHNIPSNEDDFFSLVAFAFARDLLSQERAHQ